MDINQILHMNGGAGEDSYAQNSSWQSNVLSMTKPYTEQALVELLSSHAISEGKIGIADLRCSSGPTELDTMWHILKVVYDSWQKKGEKSIEVAVYLNDLPGNDFNCLFGSFPGFFEKLREEKGDGIGPCFVFGAPGSFYDGLFPSQSLHFVHSSSSLHWFFKIPRGLDPKTRPALNKGKINISKTSSKEIVDAYIKQFESDFSSFLESRSKEVVCERKNGALLRRKGKVEEEKVDSFNVPSYFPCPGEIEHLVQTQGSFQIDHLQTFEINWDGLPENESIRSESEKNVTNGTMRISRGEKVARIDRAILEPIFEYHFGKSIMDEFFHRYGLTIDSYLAMREPKFINVIVTLVRKSHEG